GRGGGLLIGIDLQKNIDVIEAAYNDARGVTAEFNLNMLRHINRELSGDFQLDEFEHRAVYDRDEHRVEISLVSTRDQAVSVCDRSFELRKDEQILTEYSHKYTVEGFAKLASEAGLTLKAHWMDSDDLFAVLHLVVE
ncbi:MAG: L-histidine N(alpha)-methyltransferase, partial [Planctomycetota bacterium]